VRLGIVRLQFQRPAIAGDRFVELPLILQRIAEVVVRVGIVGLQFQRPAVAGDRFGIQLPLVLESLARL
jgi:acyl dehydratase